MKHPSTSRRTDTSHTRTALVVGGSLAGLMSALALARVGYTVTVLERSGDSGRTGAALHAPGDLIEQLTGAPRRGAVPMYGGTQTWFGVHGALRSEAEADPRITLRDGTRVVEVDQSEASTWARLQDDELVYADIIVGADGHRSVVRKAVSPEHPNARFAGYLIWLGVVQEKAIASHHAWPSSAAILSAGKHHFLGVSVPGQAGFLAEGQRQLAWALYDAGWNDLLREKGCVRDGIVNHTLQAKDIPERVFQHLLRSASLWPPIWKAAILDCVARGAVIGTPVAEYLPLRLSLDRIVLVGDAAHVPTPMTGNGFSASLSDAKALGIALSKSHNVTEALQAYGESRLGAAQNLVRSGQDFSRSFGRL